MTKGSAPLRILILAHAFPPMNAIASHRPYSWARCWTDAGHHVEVLTLQKYAFDGTMDLQRDLHGIAVHEVAYLDQARMRSVAASADASPAVRRWERVRTVTRRARFSLGMFGDPRLYLAFRPLLRRARELVALQRFDLIVATSPPEVLFFVARRVSRETGIPWIADLRDLWFRDMRLYQFRFTSWLSGPVNRRVLRDASALMTVSRGLQERLAGYLRRDVQVSYNGFFETESSDGQMPGIWDDDRRHIVYTGRLYPGKRDPEPLFRALARARSAGGDVPQRIAVHFFSFDDPWLRALATQYGLEDCVMLHDYVTYQRSIELQRAADVLLFLDWTDTQAEGVLTGKLFEYLGAGRPILALGPRKDSEAAAVIAESGCGTTLTSEAEVADYLVKLAASPRPPAVASPGRDRFSRERQALELLQVIERRFLPPGHRARRTQ